MLVGAPSIGTPVAARVRDASTETTITARAGVGGVQAAVELGSLMGPTSPVPWEAHYRVGRRGRTSRRCGCSSCRCAIVGAASGEVEKPCMVVQDRECP